MKRLGLDEKVQANGAWISEGGVGAAGFSNRVI